MALHGGRPSALDKPIKSCRGRLFTFDDLAHHHQMVVALNETIRLMAEADATIPAWPVT